MRKFSSAEENSQIVDDIPLSQVSDAQKASAASARGQSLSSYDLSKAKEDEASG